MKGRMFVTLTIFSLFGREEIARVARVSAKASKDKKSLELQTSIIKDTRK